MPSQPTPVLQTVAPPPSQPSPLKVAELSTAATSSPLPVASSIHVEEPTDRQTIPSPVVPAVAITTAVAHEPSPERQKETTPPAKVSSLSAGSFGGSMSSIYSAAGGGKGDYDISGEVRFGVFYKDGQLVVHVSRAKGLAAANSSGFSDPYVKTYLLPDKSKHSKRKTTIKKNTLDPVYNEILKVSVPGSPITQFHSSCIPIPYFFNIQYKVPWGEVTSHTLWLSVWDWDRFGRNQFLGEVRLPLSSVDLSDKGDRWFTLQDRVSKTLATAITVTVFHSHVHSRFYLGLGGIHPPLGILTLHHHPSFHRTTRATEGWMPSTAGSCSWD